MMAYREHSIGRYFLSFPRHNVTVGDRRQASNAQQIPFSDGHPSFKTYEASISTRTNFILESERVQFDISKNEVRERRSPKSSSSEEPEERSEAAQIAQLKAKLADSMKQIEILSR